MQSVLSILTEHFPQVRTNIIGKPFIKQNDPLSRASVIIGDSNVSDMRQPIADDGIHIHINQSADVPVRSVAKNKSDSILANYEIRDIASYCINEECMASDGKRRPVG